MSFPLQKWSGDPLHPTPVQLPAPGIVPSDSPETTGKSARPRGECPDLPRPDAPGLDAPPLPEGFLGGDVARTPLGTAYVVERRVPGRLAIPESALPELHRLLRLVRGVGPYTQVSLSGQGYLQIQDLVGHPRWDAPARNALAAIDELHIDRLRRRGVSGRQLLSLFTADSVALVDIETAGLGSASPLFLVGVLAGCGEHLVLRQFLARSFEEEPSALHLAATELGRFGLLVSYNGRSFDVPFIANRLAYHKISERFRFAQLDLLHEVRRIMRDGLPDCRLVTLEEKVLKLPRKEDIPSELIPDYYFRFVRSGDTSIIERIMEHNARDLLTLAALMEVLFGVRR